MKHLLVIGGASSDILHLADQTVACAGGAGMYTAMAARRSGIQAAMFGPRPDPCPEDLKPVAKHLSEWLGPVVAPDQMPHFEISYQQGKTDYIKALLDAELILAPTALPADLSGYDLVHVVPLGDTAKQLTFVQACRERGAKRISAGTWLRGAVEQTQTVQAVINHSDYFFMNIGEAEAIFGSLDAAHTQPGKVLFVTLGAQGACIIQGDTATLIPTVSTEVLDPTGAGDTFCGATLAYLLQDHHPVMAARRAVTLASEMVTAVGPAVLLQDTPSPPIAHDARVRVNDTQVQQVAQIIATLPEASPYPFVSPELPPVGHPKALDYFFATTLHQFSFWYEHNNAYDKPMIAQLDGTMLKGSDYLWRAFTRQMEQDAEFCSPERQANLSQDELLAVFRADDGIDPMPAVDLHLKLSQQYGRDMLALGLTPQIILQKALESPQPLQTFISMLDHISGYKEDPLRKKSSLLALILNQRPETFLPLADEEEVAPIIDYHALRLSLRIGLLDVVDAALKHKLINQQVVSPDEEWAVRYATYCAREQVTALSGRSEGTVDWLFFSARKFCPEMSAPECPRCQLNPVCAHRTDFFQPVLRTTFY